MYRIYAFFLISGSISLDIEKEGQIHAHRRREE